jgi:hypothetical protein
VKFLSPEWRTEAEIKLKTELDPAEWKGITVALAMTYLNCPGGETKTLLFRLKEGELVELSLGPGEPAQAEFRLSGDYQVYLRIARGELGAQLAVMQGQLQFKGNMLQALKLAPLADKLNKILAGIPAEY